MSKFCCRTILPQAVFDPNSIVADPDTQSPQKPFSRGSARGVRHMAQELRLSRRPARIIPTVR